MEIKYFSGRVIWKGIDKPNHGYPSIKIRTQERTKMISLVNDKSKFFDEINIGDSIIKEQKSLIIKIWSNNKIKFKQLDYQCKK